MKRRLILLATPALILPYRAKAQFTPPSLLGASYVFSAPSYTGPGDIATFKAWYGLRGYSAAVAAPGTQKAITVRRASDNTTQDIVILNTGSLDVASLTTFINATTGFVTKWFDQTGNGFDVVQATSGSQPQILAGGFGAVTGPAMSFDGAAQYLAASFSNTTGPTTSSAVVLCTDSSSAPHFDEDYLSTYDGTKYTIASFNGASFGGGGASTQIASNAGVYIGQATTVSTWYAINGTYDTPSTTITVNGSVTSGTSSGNGDTGATITVGNLQTGGNRFFPGYMTEAGIGAFTGSNASLNSNQRAFWSI